MSNPSQPRSAAAVLKDLSGFLADDPLDIDALSDAEVKAHLNKRGLNPLLSFQVMQDFLESEVAAVELVLAKEARLKRLEAIAKPTVFEEGLCEKIHKLINSLSPQVAGGYFSKFENATEEDLQSLYEDLKALAEGNRPDNGDHA